ncbi:alanine racemase [candidate division KSB1 bacterium]|nr:alanine racemase [candidate division KSB1 bacterium]
MRPTAAIIDLSAYRYNLEQIKKRVSPAQVMAVVKANAYGHGMIQCARAALEAGATYLGVALVEEGIALRQQRIEAPVLVFCGVIPEQIALFIENRLEMVLYFESVAADVSRLAQRMGKPAIAHIKIDTGMGRVGVRWDNALPVIQKIAQLPALRLKGICTHFATSDERDKVFANQQLKRFNQIVEQLAIIGIHFQLKHVANSGAILDMPDSYFDMVRPGIVSFGWYPSEETSESLALKPVMTFKTRVLYIKEIQAGESVSYGRKFIAQQRTRIATLPVGYGDGYNRLLTNQGAVLIRGKRFPVVGRICMDLIHVDIGYDSEIKEGDDVVLFGQQMSEFIPVTDICRKINTIPYEVLCGISNRVPRIYQYE